MAAQGLPVGRDAFRSLQSPGSYCAGPTHLAAADGKEDASAAALDGRVVVLQSVKWGRVGLMFTTQHMLALKRTRGRQGQQRTRTAMTFFSASWPPPRGSCRHRQQMERPSMLLACKQAADHQSAMHTASS